MNQGSRLLLRIANSKPPTYYSFKDIKKRTIGHSLTELPFTCRFGADLVFHETEQSRVESAAVYRMDELQCTFLNPAICQIA